MAELLRFRDFCAWVAGCLTGEGSFDGLGSAGRGLSSCCGLDGLRAMDCAGGGFVLLWEVWCCARSSPIFMFRMPTGTLFILLSIRALRSEHCNA